MTDTFFTSDTHYGHSAIIKYCNRPFVDVNEMNEQMIQRWNSVVGQYDIVYHIGDVIMGKDEHKILPRLNGIKHLIKGNHDKQPNHRFWQSVSDYKDIYIDKQFIVMSHYPMITWNKSHYGSWMLHGHCHGNLPDDSKQLRIDVGVDCHNYTPISYDDIRRIMNKKNPDKLIGRNPDL